ncbi:MAG: transcription antitermination factor NusB [Syntrophorhabdus sp.]
MLYQVETAGDDPERALTRYCSLFPYQQDIVDYARYLLTGICAHQDKIDEYIRKAAENWRIDRIAYVDKNVLRIGIFEMLLSEDVPPKVAIDEAIEMGKKYGSEDSSEFINGVLDRIMKDFYKKEK